MLKLSNASFLISALLAGAAFTQTASATVVIDQPLAREASEGSRGEGGRGRGSEGAGHPAIEVIEQLV